MEYKPFESVLPRLSEWADFLTVESNKSKLIHLLADYFISSNITEKEIYVTEVNKSFHVPVPMNSLAISTEVEELYSLQRKADPPIALHVACASASHGGVCVVADATDVFILLLFVAERCTTNLYFRQGTHSSKEGITYHNVTSLNNHHGENICRFFPGFQALTGYGLHKTVFWEIKIWDLQENVSKLSVRKIVTKSLND